MKCGKPLGESDGEYCMDCGKTGHAYDRGRALFLYDDRLRDSIAAFKYRGRREYKRFYGEELSLAFGVQAARWRPEVLIPVPLHPSRRRKRGYNQAELLARELGRSWHIPVETGLLVRVEKTLPQKGLGGRERRRNMKTAFKIRPDHVKFKTILLIDDIYTTGSTMDAAARALKEKGAGKVYFLCIGIGSGR